MGSRPPYGGLLCGNDALNAKRRQEINSEARAMPWGVIPFVIENRPCSELA